MEDLQPPLLKVVCVLQNQWFYDPPRIKRMLAYPTQDKQKLRRRLLAYALFAGCKSGRMLRQHLGDKWCDRALWENASDEIGDCASSCFPADPRHLLTVVRTEKPHVVIGFGKVACDAFHNGQDYERGQRDVIEWGGHEFHFISASHPTARHEGIGEEFCRLRKLLDTFETNHCHAHST